MKKRNLFDILKSYAIPYRLFEHQPVFTVQERPVVIAVDGKPASGSIPGVHFKTLFLRDKKNSFFLVSVTQEKRVDLNALSRVLGSGRLSFGRPEQLMALLRLTPGSVSPFGLIFDQDRQVRFFLDEDAVQGDFVGFHPLQNDMTIVMAPQDFLTCMEREGHSPKIIPIPVK